MFHKPARKVGKWVPDCSIAVVLVASLYTDPDYAKVAEPRVVVGCYYLHSLAGGKYAHRPRTGLRRSCKSKVENNIRDSCSI